MWTVSLCHNCRHSAVLIATVLCGNLLAQVERGGRVCDLSTEQGSSVGSASGGLDDEPTTNSTIHLPECIPLTETILDEKIYDECHPFLSNRCYISDYLDYDRARSELSLLNAALLGSSPRHIQRECWDVIRAFVCNYYYVGCNKSTRLQQGICVDSCAEFVQNGDCAPSFVWLANFAVATGSSFVFTPECDNPLWYVAVHDPSLENVTVDREGCINVSEVVENPTIIPVPTEEETHPMESDKPGNNLGTIIGATLGVTILVTFIITALLLSLGVYIRRVKKQKMKIRHNLMDSMSADRRSSLNNYRINEPFTHPRGSVVSIEYDPVGRFKLTHEDIELLSKELRDALIPFHQVKITGDLGEGAFGCVYKGILTRVTDEGIEEIGVAIKTIKNHLAYHELKNFLEESSIMCSFSHPNVLGMEGICLDEESQSPYLILPFMKNGDLKTYLRKKRGISHLVDVNYPDKLSNNTLLGMCYQIACGMEYLASRKLVHRDLAARNCMIDRDHSVKVADFGLTRDIYQKDYYRQNSRGQIPVKWMAPESLVDHISNEKTDVWSFGVTCWEVFSLGRVPYPTVSNSEVVDYLISGRRLQKPNLCKDKLYDVMLLCWKTNPENRPTFEALVEMLQNFLIDAHSEQVSHFGSPGRGEGSYVDMSDISSSDNTTSDDSAVFANTSTPFGYVASSRYSDVHHSRNRYSYQESSRHTPQVPSSLLHSVSYDLPHSIPRESFLQNNLSAGSAASVYLEMTPAMPALLTTLQECDSPES